MSRVKLDLPDEFQFSTEISVRIGDINYGGHLGNDSVLSMVHEARVRFLKHYGFTEADIDGVGIIMTDAVIVYKSEGFYGNILRVEVSVQDLSKVGCDFIFRLTNKESASEIARAKTGVVFFDYKQKKIISMSDKFKALFPNRND
ncbi:MAG: thioesterase family protein [bacterium]